MTRPPQDGKFSHKNQIMEIILFGDVISNNHIYRSWRGRTYMTEEAKALKERYKVQMRDAYKWAPLSWPVEIWVKLYRRAQEPDRDNIHKLTMDAGNKILRKDDKLIKKSLVEKIEKDNEKPRIELYFSPLWCKDTSKSLTRAEVLKWVTGTHARSVEKLLWKCITFTVA